MADIFDRMAAERARALIQKLNPIGWKVNKAAFTALRQDGAIDDAEANGPAENIRLFALPVLVDHDDTSDAPHFALLTVDLAAKT